MKDKDLSSLELRILAYERVAAGTDPYTRKAAEMFKVPVGAVTAIQRTYAKQDSYTERYSSTGRLLPSVKKFPMTPFNTIHQESFRRQAEAANRSAHEWYALTLMEMDAWRMFGIECELHGDELVVTL